LAREIKEKENESAHVQVQVAEKGDTLIMERGATLLGV